MHLIAWSIPAFVALIGLEMAVGRAKGRKLYRFADLATNLSCGLSSRLLGIFLSFATLGLYVLVYEHARVLDWDVSSPWTWVFACVAVDFLYYWWHRASHRVNALWWTHVVHHQSEDFNLAVALRQSSFAQPGLTAFYLPLAFLGIEPRVYIAASVLSLIYQFWLHTELIGKLGPLEWVLITPSHHRVHHAVNPRYLDRNYGATLVIWDRLFGSFEAESEPARFGIVAQLRSFNPVWANFERIVGLLRSSKRAMREGRLLSLWLGAPNDGQPIGDLRKRMRAEKYDVRYSRAVGVYVACQILLAAPALIWILLHVKELSVGQLLLVSSCFIAATGAWGGLLEGRRWAPWVEGARLCGSLLAIGWLGPW